MTGGPRVHRRCLLSRKENIASRAWIYARVALEAEHEQDCLCHAKVDVKRRWFSFGRSLNIRLHSSVQGTPSYLSTYTG
jgi:hypothetical protein